MTRVSAVSFFIVIVFFFFKQKTAYEMRISDWSSDVCSSDLLSGVPSDIVSVVVAVLSRMVFDFAIWSRREPKRPILLVCEEAHRYVPSDRDNNRSAVRKVLERIAKEGRKYGVSLGLITQRPADLAEGVMSQCGTIIAMRLNNERDQAYVRNARPEGARGFLESIPALRNRE